MIMKSSFKFGGAFLSKALFFDMFVGKLEKFMAKNTPWKLASMGMASGKKGNVINSLKLTVGHPKRKIHLPTINFQVQAVSFSEGKPKKGWELRRCAMYSDPGLINEGLQNVYLCLSMWDTDLKNWGLTFLPYLYMTYHLQATNMEGSFLEVAQPCTKTGQLETAPDFRNTQSTLKLTETQIARVVFVDLQENPRLK